MAPRHFFIFLFFSFSSFAFAQKQNVTDSLLQLVKQDRKDTSTISACIKLADSFSNSDYDNSLAYATKGLSIANKLNDNYWKGRCNLQMGYTHLSFGYSKEAIENFTDASAAFEKWGGTKYWIAKCANATGNAQRVLGRLKEATDSYLTAKKLYEEVKDKKGIAGAYNNLGIILMAENQPGKALDYYKLAKQMNIEINNKPWLGKNLANMGSVFFNIKQYDSALVYFDNAAEIDLAVNDPGGWATDIMNLGNVYTSLKNYPKAKEEFDQAMSYDRKNGREADMAVVMGNVSGLYMEIGDFVNAKKYLDSSFALSTKYDDLENLINLYKSYTVLYEKMGDYKNAYKYYDLYASQKDSITSSDMKNQMDQMEESFREEKLKEKNASLEQSKLLLEQSKVLQDVQLNRSHIINYTAIGGGILILLLTITIFKRYQLKKKANVVLEKQKNEIESQKEIIEQKNKDISDSINYAKNIQETLLPAISELHAAFKESFIFFRPKNIVSGDFYWFTNLGNKSILAVADCTGHGVPGAFMSMIGMEKINQAVLELNISNPSEILSTINRWLKKILKPDDFTGGMRDGMDIVMASIDREKMKLEYSGANRPLWIVRKGELIELNPVKVSLGGHTSISQKFISHEFALQKNDWIYLSSDGYADQFGGDEEKKMMVKNFKQLLISINNESAESQKKIIEERLDNWKGELDQVDDICVMGICV